VELLDEVDQKSRAAMGRCPFPPTIAWQIDDDGVYGCKFRETRGAELRMSKLEAQLDTTAEEEGWV
jgi:hypothetical protein